MASGGTETKEYLAIKHRYATLVETLGDQLGDPANFARKLQTKSLIHPQIARKAGVMGLMTGLERITPVIDAVQSQIKLKASLFHPFMEVLKEELPDLHESLNEYYASSVELNAMEAVTKVSDWKKLGLQLKVDSVKMSRLDRSGMDSKHCRKEVVQEWLNEDKSPSWEKLCRALKLMGETESVSMIKARYFSSQSFSIIVAERDALRAQLPEMHQKKASTTAMGYLRGVDVVAETSFEVTSQALTYDWRGYGVKLHIQQDSLPADCPQCRVEMKASLSGLYTLPADCELVSGLYWIYCPLKLSNHATLEVQHCSTQRKGLSFVRAECTQEQLPYMLRKQEGGVFSELSSYGSIKVYRFSVFGIVVLPYQFLIKPCFSSQMSNSQLESSSSHFSIEPQLNSQESDRQQSGSQQSDLQELSSQQSENQEPQPDSQLSDSPPSSSQQPDSHVFDTSRYEPQPDSQQSEKAQPSQKSDVLPYTAQVYYSNDIVNIWNALFTIRCRRGLDLEDTDFHLKVEKTTKQKIRKFGPVFPVDFADDLIELKLPVTPTGWKMSPLAHPAIFQSTVDSFQAYPGGVVPHCQLRITGTQVGSTLEACVGLKGAKKPYNYFQIICGPAIADGGGPHKEKKTPEQSPLSTEDFISQIPSDKCGILIHTPTQIADIAEIMEKWEAISDLFGISYAEAEVIKNDNPMHYAEQKKRAIMMWCERQGLAATYVALMRIFHKRKNRRMVDELHKLLCAQ